jgi:hypothetical protein
LGSVRGSGLSAQYFRAACSWAIFNFQRNQNRAGTARTRRGISAIRALGRKDNDVQIHGNNSLSGGPSRASRAIQARPRYTRSRTTGRFRATVERGNQAAARPRWTTRVHHGARVGRGRIFRPEVKRAAQEKSNSVKKTKERQQAARERYRKAAEKLKPRRHTKSD